MHNYGHCVQALSISRSLSRAKFAAQNGQISSRELRNSVTQAILEAGGEIDYAEVRSWDLFFLCYLGVSFPCEKIFLTI